MRRTYVEVFIWITSVLWQGIHVQRADDDVSGVRTIEIVTLGYREPIGYPSLAFSAPAIDSAMVEIRAKYKERFEFLHTFLFLPNGTMDCYEIEAQAAYALSEWYYNSKERWDAAAYIAPTCSDMYQINQLVAAWNLLMITSSASGIDQRNKTLAPTWIAAVSASATNYILLPVNLFKYFNWTNIFMVLDLDSSRSYHAGVDGILKYLPSQIPGFQSTVISVRSSAGIDNRAILLEFNVTSRVLLFFSHSDNLRKFMLQAHAMNMTNGEYVYVAQQIFHDIIEFGNFSWHYGDQFDETAREAYRSLLFIEGDPVIYSTPSSKLVNEWKRQSFANFHFKYENNEEVNPVVTATYLSILIFAQVISDTLEAEPDFNISDGALLASQFYDSSFHFNFTDVYFDLAGERSTKIMINDLNYTTGKYQVAMFQDEKFRRLHAVLPIDWGGKSNSSPLNQPICGYRGNRGPCALISTDEKRTYATIFGALLGVLLVIFLCSIFAIRRYRYIQQFRDAWWLIDRTYLQFHTAGSRISAAENTNLQYLGQNMKPTKGMARYRDMEVWADEIPLPDDADKMFSDGEKIRRGFGRINFSASVLDILRTLRDAPSDNINKFLGMCGYPDHRMLFFISNYCHKGSLHDLFHQPYFEDQFRVSLILDLLEGLVWIHSSFVRFHGFLTGWVCLIDRHFALKIGRFGYYHLLDQPYYKTMPYSIEKLPTDKLFWTAPELLKMAITAPNSATDIFATGVILNQIICSSLPYNDLKEYLAAIDLLEQIRKGQNLQTTPRPSLSESSYLGKRLNFVIKNCWDEIPQRRKTIQAVRNEVYFALNIKDRRRGHLMEEILKRLEMYAQTLERDVTSRTHALMSERKKCDDLLREMLPSSVVEQLRAGHTVNSENFDSVTIMFSDMFGFSQYAAGSSPTDVTELLNAVYSVFDKVLVVFDVYKVETIGEVYMVASGVPVRNGIAHAKEICSLALALQQHFAASDFAHFLSLRSGINSGSCVGGVVGLQKPRYCLFGDTVNFASRMESTGLPNRVQITETTRKILLDYHPYFDIVLRGTVFVKGKGDVNTYWLNN
ncbi:atrial natriuretic peptide receptor 1-like [Paramacrobiotus metropolitanus]|uniref:atrial natriuretic peptide receptor 1-like n=1 Tax=Paramacrobiotus metropolitanus TaxID=2943436 RepID=UPI0024463AB8|nr:atrial natriuretic peptide receptor 1-like [Paramacrobiotus metropolitanus]